MKKFILFAAVAVAALASCQKGSMKPVLGNEADTISYEMGMVYSEELPGYMAQQNIDSIYREEFLAGMKDGIYKSSDAKKVAYYMGVMYGINASKQLESTEQYVWGDSVKHLNRRNYLAGVVNGLHHKSNLSLGGVPVGPQEAMADAEKRLQEVYARQFEMAKQQNREYIANYAKQEGVVALPSGVCYKVLHEGEGEVVGNSEMVSLYYELRLIDGSLLDGNYGTPDPTTMNTASLVPGFREALSLMKVGSEWEVVIPAVLGYGDQSYGPLKPGSTLIFKIKVASI